MPLSWQDLYRVIQGKTPLQTLIDPGEDEPDFFVPGLNQRGGQTTAQWMRALGGRPFPTVQPPKPPKPKTLDDLLGGLPGIGVSPIGRNQDGLPFTGLDPIQTLSDFEDLGDLASRVTFDPSWEGALEGAVKGGTLGGLLGTGVAPGPGTGFGTAAGGLTGLVVGGLGPGLKEKIELPDRPDPDPYLTTLTNPTGPSDPQGLYTPSSVQQPPDPDLVSITDYDMEVGSGTDLTGIGTGLYNVVGALTNEEASDPYRIVQGLSGATKLYNTIAPMTGLEAIPYVGTALKLANLGLNAYDIYSDPNKQDMQKAHDIIANIGGAIGDTIVPGVGSMLERAATEIARQHIWPRIPSHEEREALETGEIGARVRHILGSIEDAETAEDLHRVATQSNFTFDSPDPSAWLNVPMAHGDTPEETLALLLTGAGGANVQAGLQDTFRGPMNTALNNALKQQAALIQAAEQASTGSPAGRRYQASDILYAAENKDRYPSMSYENLDRAQMDRLIGKQLLANQARGVALYGPGLDPDLIYNRQGLTDPLTALGASPEDIANAWTRYGERASRYQDILGGDPDTFEASLRGLIGNVPARRIQGNLTPPADSIGALTRQLANMQVGPDDGNYGAMLSLQRLLEDKLAGSPNPYLTTQLAQDPDLEALAALLRMSSE